MIKFDTLTVERLECFCLRKLLAKLKIKTPAVRVKESNIKILPKL